MTDTSLELTIKLIQGDEESFKITFENYYSAHCCYAEKFLRDKDESRSLVQQVFVDLWDKRKKLVIDRSLKSYLYKVVRNHALDYLKHKAVENKFLKELPAENSSFDPNLTEEAELNSRIQCAINKLPVKCREIFILCRFNGLHYNEIAIKQGISVKTVEMQMGIALRKLRNQLLDIVNK